MRWWAAGLVMYSFAAPSSIMGVAFTFSHAGLLVGTLGCIVVMGASAAGALLLTDLTAACPDAKMLSDVGRSALGPVGEQIGLVLQMVNFVLYLPVALLTTAQALQDTLQPEGTTCTNYFVFAVALVCFASTQVRDLANSTPLAIVALIASVMVALLQLVVVVSHPSSDTKARAVGSAATTAQGIEMALSLTACAWAYVPSLLTVELAHVVGSARELRQAIALSACLSMASFIGVGFSVAALWGSDVPDPVTLSASWPKHSATARVMSGLLALANLVSYGLDSVPFCRWCQRRIDPGFSDGWSPRECFRYALISLPSIVFALLAAVLVGQPGGLFTMLAWVTAITIPPLNFIFPAVCTLYGRSAPATEPGPSPALSSPPSSLSALAAVEKEWFTSSLIHTSSSRQAARLAKRRISLLVLSVGIVAFLVCTFAAVGRSVVESVRGPEVIGCKGWGIFRSDGMNFSGF